MAKNNTRKRTNFSPHARQMLVALAPQLSAISMGGSIGFPSILLQQLKSKDSSIRPDLNILTWIASVHGLAGLGGLLMPSLMQKIGRKRSFIMSCLLLISGWILAYTATNAAMILAAECLLGLGCNCIVVVNLITVSEMLAPKYRTVSMMLLGITQASGIILVTLLGTFLYWRILALIMCCPVLIAFILVFAWPESPPWLAYKGNYGECERAFKWLRGTNDESLKELQELIISQKKLEVFVYQKTMVNEFLSKLKRKDFLIPTVFMVLVLMNFYTSGGLCLLIYGKYVIEIATGDDHASTVGFLMNDANLLVGAIVALFIIRNFNAKTILHLGSLRIVFLLLCSLVLLLQEHSLLSKSPWVFVSFFECYMLFFCSGLNTITFALAIELMPVKHRGVGGALYNVFTCSLHFLFNKLLPYLIMWINIKAVFLFFALNGLACQVLIWKYLPETKNRTLQEIEDYYNNECSFTKKIQSEIDVKVPMFEENNESK